LKRSNGEGRAHGDDLGVESMLPEKTFLASGPDIQEA
jgi:hypothetical protein